MVRTKALRIVLDGSWYPFALYERPAGGGCASIIRAAPGAARACDVVISWSARSA